jgi:glucokinase
MSDLVPVLEVGGTHVSSAIVDSATWTLHAPATRRRVRSAGSADEIVDEFVAAADATGAAARLVWGVAMPDPFDYAHGVALFRGVGKFESLYGIDIGAALRARATAQPAAIAFINDADAFTLGEWLNGAATGAAKCAGITLGTGVGSGWVADGHIVDSGPDVPPGGRAHRLFVGGVALEDVMSRRAIRRAYAASTGDDVADVAEICARARSGEPAAVAVLGPALRTLGAALAGPVSRFGADVVVVGGSMAASWDVLEPPFVEGFSTVAVPPKLAVAIDADRAPLLGAARRAIEFRAADKDS